MAVFTVLQEVPPLGFGVMPGSNTYKAVARGTREGSDKAICEYAWRATNSVEDVWTEVGAKEFGLTDIAPESRSTSMGDIVKIEDEAGDRYYYCEMMGWSKMASAPKTV